GRDPVRADPARHRRRRRLRVLLERRRARDPDPALAGRDRRRPADRANRDLHDRRLQRAPDRRARRRRGVLQRGL
ncbi:MAG: hypothetical protein AVDCRST_MAG67-3544, partial [uncultured Solirubrobacteraceae bacterium]